VTFRRVTSAWFAHLSPVWQVRWALGLGLGGSNAVGVAVVYVLATVVVPMPPVQEQAAVQLENVLLGAAYVVVAGALGITTGWRVLHPVVTLLDPDCPITDKDGRDVLAAPGRIFVAQGLLWALGSVIFLIANTRHSLRLGVSVSLIVGLAGWATSCLTYLIAERSLRPVARRVLASGIPGRRFVRSVADRAMFAWALGTGVALVGIVIVGAVALTDPGHVTTRELATTILVLGGITLAVGLLSSYVAAQASSEPIRNLREALAQVQRGDLDVQIGIYDGTEIGMLQAGFNETVKGLRERESLRDLFGRHVGADVAKAALDRGVRLGGEARDVAVLFVDIIGSTALAEKRPPEEVVELLNQFFDVVIDVVHEHDGWINKFEGDAALAVWGAPVEIDDMHTAALTTARVLGRRLSDEVHGIEAGIGLSCGTAVAGNVGTRERFEYTVIGDPVNEAARLTNHAKNVPMRVVANYGLVASADAEEAARWRELEPVTVRGRSRVTRVATPAD
jgi:adenylate cyclase